MTEDKIIYREATEADFPVVASMYAKLDQLLRQHNYNFPVVEKVGELWLDMFRRTLGRFSVLYVAEYEGEVVGFIVARLKRALEEIGAQEAGGAGHQEATVPFSHDAFCRQYVVPGSPRPSRSFVSGR